MKLRLKRIIAAAFMLLLFAANLQANNITVSNLSLTGTNTTDKYVMVQFDLTWENSWRYSSGLTNWDAAWVFVKYRVGTGEWQHARLNSTGHSGSGATIDAGLQTPGSAFNATTNPAVGVFIYRSANGTGTFSITGAQLRWNYGANGVSDYATVDVKVFAIEMVYVPQGSFYVGSGGAEFSAFYHYPTTTNPYLVSSENAITVGTATDNLYYLFYVEGGDQGGPIPAAFPKGFAAFYCMKYEITQQQYVDFLNTLTRAQQNSRTNTLLAAETTSVTNRYVMSNSTTLQRRNGIRCDATIHTSDPITFYCDLNGNETGGEAGDGQWIACNYLNWMDGAAYSDWAGLRPMTELEFEKACRGTATPVANEYAWGTTTATAANNITNPGASDETTITPDANAVFGNKTNVQGPMRVGVFATIATTRTQAGASFYGIMELSGNLWERPVTVGNADGRAYTGVHGDGALSTNGNATETAWPGLTGSPGEVTGASGSSLRGGNLVATTAEALQVSRRIFAASTETIRNITYGFRAVRLAP
jgi:formylglycine-generating enzyme required for sulfatase activity